MFKRLFFIAAGAVLATLGANDAAQAIVVSKNPDAFRTSNSTSEVRETNGIARLKINYSGGSASCTGTLLPSGKDILTAAHCLTNRNGVLDVLRTSVEFGESTQTVTLTSAVSSNGYYIYPGWDGFSGGDIAVLKLSRVLPSGYSRHDLYRRTDEVGKLFTLLGFGQSGMGSKGATLEAGVKRSGLNRVDVALNRFGPIAGNQLIFDYDGPSQVDTSAQVFGVNDPGLGGVESMIAFGDSGGPALIDGKIVGISSYILSPGSPLDVDSQLNSSFGELGGLTRVSSYLQFIDDAMNSRIAPTQKGQTAKGQTASRSTTSGNVALIRYDYTADGFVNDADEAEVSVPEPTSILGLLAASVSGAGLLSRKRKRPSESQQSI